MEEFMNDVIKALEMKLGEGYRILPKEQRKNNELVLYGICIHKENESMSYTGWAWKSCLQKMPAIPLISST